MTTIEVIPDHPSVAELDLLSGWGIEARRQIVE
jgi:hypothetical protein